MSTVTVSLAEQLAQEASSLVSKMDKLNDRHKIAQAEMASTKDEYNQLHEKWTHINTQIEELFK